MLSYIIPHKGRHGMLLHHLNNLDHHSDVEVIVVDDCNEDMPDLSQYPVKVIRNERQGVNCARNLGALTAQYENLLFVGSDCIPSHYLAREHIIALNSGAMVTQGYSPFHHSAMGTVFMAFLESSGVQANWNALVGEDGNWKPNALGYCLTTNFGIKKQLFLEMGMFDENFTHPAWDDIEFGGRLRKLNIPTAILPNAVNWHVHKYTLRQYIGRQMMEGRNRLLLARAIPEMTAQVVNPEAIRQARKTNLVRLHESAVDTYRLPEIFPQVARMTLDTASQWGLIETLDAPLVWYYEHAPNGECAFMLSMMRKSLLDGNETYAKHVANWLLEKDPSKHSANLASELHRALGENELADVLTKTAIERGVS